MSDTLVLRFLYRTVPGRVILKLLVQPKLSEAAGMLLSSRLSAPFARYYIRRYGIRLDGIEVPEGGFSSFNEFFTRKRKIPCAHPGEDELISPCDGFLSCVKIKKDTVFPVKHTGFSLEELLRDQRLARRFEDGTALIFRLTPANYHRYVYAADGRVLARRKIPGILHCVRPVALHTFPVFAQNSREYEVIRSRMGLLVQMEVGALLVGKIANHEHGQAETPQQARGRHGQAETPQSMHRHTEQPEPARGDRRHEEMSQRARGRHGHEEMSQQARGYPVCAGAEKGYFAFGGSTIILLLEKASVRFCGEWIRRSPENGEIPVKAGELLAKKDFTEHSLFSSSNVIE